MVILENHLRAVDVATLLDPKQFALRIPAYQRPFAWQPATVLQLIDDVLESRADHARRDVPYVLGSVILHRRSDEVLDIVDGQQRILTLSMILRFLGDLSAPSWLPADARNPVALAWSTITHRLAADAVEDRSDLTEYFGRCCQVVVVETDDLDEAFRVFDSQNYRGKPLAPHDLLKAHHLRAMNSESSAMKAAVVESWESVPDADLSRLFSTYLYRISQWSRGASAPGFTTRDITLFKGIKGQPELAPHVRYHLAAQAALPAFATFGAAACSERELLRSRFQLDAPCVEGRTFFEMIAFLLGELEDLAAEAFAGLERFSYYAVEAIPSRAEPRQALREQPSKSRYRYVSELYLAALLYYTNRFGAEDFPAAKRTLFAWAFGLRVELSRVQYRSADNRALGRDAGGPAFTMIRDALSGRAIASLNTRSQSSTEGHEVALAAQISQHGQP